MRAGIGHAVPSVVVGQIAVQGIVLAKGKEKDLHPREAETGDGFAYVGRDDSQVFRNQREAGERAAEPVKEVIRRHLHPAPVDRARLLGRHFPIGHESPEVVYPNQVAEAQRVAQALHPPGITGLPESIPIVHRIIPQLAAGAEIVGRHPCHRNGPFLAVEFEYLPMGPDGTLSC
jgi:hypothetical protein